MAKPDDSPQAIANLSEEINDVIRMIQEDPKALQRIVKTLGSVDKMLSDLKTCQKTFLKSIADKDAKIKELQSKTESTELVYQKSLKEAHQGIADKEASLSETNHELNSLRQEIEDKHKIVVNLTDQLRKFQTDIDELEDKEERIETLEIANKRLKDDLKSLTEEYLKMVNERETEAASQDKVEIEELSKQVLDKMNANPEHPITKAALTEFGTLEECAKRPLNMMKLLNKFLEPAEAQVEAKELIAELTTQEFPKEATSQPEAQTTPIKPMTKNRKFASASAIKRPEKSPWTDVFASKSVMAAIGKNQSVKLKQVYSHYTKKTTGFFDPYLQYGGKSIVNSENKGKGSRYKLSIEDNEGPKNRIEDEAGTSKLMREYQELPGWLSAKDYFANNGTDSPSYRSPSPDKITSSPRVLPQ